MGSASANFPIYSSFSSSPIPSGSAWVTLPLFRIFAWVWHHVSRDFSSSVLGTANSSAYFSLFVSSSISRRPLGIIEVAWVILAIYDLKKCLSFPGNGGLLSI